MREEFGAIRGVKHLRLLAGRGRRIVSATNNNRPNDCRAADTGMASDCGQTHGLVRI